jgi:hypothetical protein
MIGFDQKIVFCSGHSLVEYVRLGAFNPSRDYRQPAVDRFTVFALVSAACFVPRSRYLDEYLLFAVQSPAVAQQDRLTAANLYAASLYLAAY